MQNQNLVNAFAGNGAPYETRLDLTPARVLAPGGRQGGLPGALAHHHRRLRRGEATHQQHPVVARLLALHVAGRVDQARFLQGVHPLVDGADLLIELADDER